MMSTPYQQLAAVLQRVRTRWRASMSLRSWTRAATVITLIVAGALVSHLILQPDAPGLIALWSAAVVAIIAGAVWLLAPLRRNPSDHQVARYVEEHCPELEDTLATAVAQVRQDDGSPMRAAVAADAVRRVQAIDLDRVISTNALRKAAAVAAAATLAFVVVSVLAIGPASRAAHALALYAFPQRVVIVVAPGNARVPAGTALRIVARLPGARDVIVPSLRVFEEGEWRETRMESAADGFTASFDDVQTTFRYAVAAAGTTSSEYTVTVMHLPHVERIDVRYEYPAAFRMEPRLEEDGGDIYGPAGTRVRLAVHTDKPVTEGAIALEKGKSVTLVHRRPDLLEAELTITEDASYRVALADADGLRNPGDTAYFIRTLQDSPPDVRIIRPAGDRPVTPIEEVPVEAKADDDFGIAAFDLVFSVRGGEEQIVPFRRQGAGLTVTGERTIYLEDLRVQPGDFVTYYARARDISRGKRSAEARSDIFFLEVKPFEEEFVSAQSRGGGAGGDEEDRSLEALIAGQKDVITATWRLDRRGRDAGMQSAGDVRSVARAQAELRRRALGVSALSPRADDLRRRLRGQTARASASDQPIAKAIDAMDSAQEQLEALRTSSALPHEMTALNELMRAQAEIRRREVQWQEANNNGGGGGSNRQTQDLSSLFDRELARQQTNYETPTSSETREQKPNNANDALEKIRELARRQEALNREQENLATSRDGMSEDELRRRLERLTREQSELRQQAEDLSQQIQRDRLRQGSGAQGEEARDQPSGRGSQSDPSSRARGALAQGKPSEEAGRALQQAAEEMKSAASGLRRQDEGQAAASGSRALERLRQGEQQIRGGQPDERGRDLGELQLETRQLADAQRRLARDTQQQAADADAVRRHAGEQERLADRAQRLEDAVRQLAGNGTGNRGGSAAAGPQQRAALAEAARELERQKLPERMRNAAVSGQRGEQETPEIARALDRVGDRLGDAAGESAADRQSAQQLSRAGELREQLEAVDRQLAELQRNGAGRGQGASPGNGRSTQSQSQGRGTGSVTSGAWEQARQLVEQLRREEEAGLSTRDVEGFNPGISAPGTEAFKQDFARWEQLKVQLAAALERVETSAAARLRAGQVKDRLNAGGSQAVPEQYRELVDKYYRALASRQPREP